jgi:hypothetical protein
MSVGTRFYLSADSSVKTVTRWDGPLKESLSDGRRVSLLLKSVRDLPGPDGPIAVVTHRLHLYVRTRNDAWFTGGQCESRRWLTVSFTSATVAISHLLFAMITRKTVKDVVKEGDDGAQFPTSQDCTPSSDSMTVASSLSRFLLCAGMYSGMCTLGLQWGFILIRLSDTVISFTSATVAISHLLVCRACPKDGERPSNTNWRIATAMGGPNDDGSGVPYNDPTIESQLVMAVFYPLLRFLICFDGTRKIKMLL